MEALLRRELGCDFVKATGHSGGGCISQGQSYDTDRGRVFVKVNSKAELQIFCVGLPTPAAYFSLLSRSSRHFREGGFTSGYVHRSPCTSPQVIIGFILRLTLLFTTSALVQSAAGAQSFSLYFLKRTFGKFS
uniref:Uncharacterized protein n=1 Tax=Felis catus TaxID=9685 RepID=A0ABI7WIE3_FELCA